MEKNEIITAKLEYIGEDINSIKPYMSDYLYKIESIIIEKTAIQEVALQTLRENSFTVSSISKELDCSRTTLYNHNQLLKRYINHSLDVYNHNNPFEAYDILKASKDKLQEQLNLMIERDFNLEILKQENMQLTRDIQDNNKEITRLHLRVKELSSELHNIKKSGNHSNSDNITLLQKK